MNFLNGNLTFPCSIILMNNSFSGKLFDLEHINTSNKYGINFEFDSYYENNFAGFSLLGLSLLFLKTNYM